jgi:hypothetical protein
MQGKEMERDFTPKVALSDPMPWLSSQSLPLTTDCSLQNDAADKGSLHNTMCLGL